ncbi:MFS transporter [Promicromonospora iranensis]|uniref:MFS transporter n=1 Tax=Promicromonospora iranensis TaxID=1105144 RepID=UPI0023A92BC0|nr:MFS transporter [Promicromonospora iranensis]
MRISPADDSVRASTLRGPVVLFMAVAAALGTAATYPLQPAIADVAASLDSSTSALGMALACGPAGYLAGLGLLVPLVDRFPPRYVLTAQLVALSLSIGATAAASTSWLLGLCVLLTGLCSSVGAGLSSVAGRLSSAGSRATVLGIVTAGISAGILLGRIAGGWLADAVGWRGMLLAFAGGCLLTAGAAWLLLPRVGRGGRNGYLATLRSMPGLFVRFSPLRLAAARGAAWFFAFCAVWAGLAVALSAPPYDYSAERIGLYALAGLTGILATRVAGVLTDRVGAHTVILVGLGAAGVAAAAMGFALGSPLLLVVCLALFDAGLFAAQVANQSTVLAIDPQAPARFNSAYMMVYFIGGSLGTAFGAAAAAWMGWPGTTAVVVAALAVAAAITLAAAGPGARRPDRRKKGESGGELLAVNRGIE